MVRSVARMAGLVTLAIIILLLFFAIDIETRLPWMILALVVASAVAAPPSPDASQWRSVWPYGLYIVGLAVALAFSRSSQSVSEVGRQALFLATVFAAANLRPRERTRAGLLLLVLAGITVNLARVFGDPYRYRLDFVHRAEGFGRVSQWSGYPEIGLLAAIGAAAALATVAAAPRRPLQLSAAVLWGVFVLATGLSYSRLAWVTVGVVSVTLLALAWYRWRAASAGVLLATLVLAGILAGGSSIGRLRAGSLDASPIALRAVEWKAALAMFLDRPGVGVGPGRYPDAFPQYTDAVEVEGETEGYGAHAHNIVLQVAAELGIIGLLGYVAMWARVLWRSYSAGGPSHAGVVAFAVHACLLTVFVRSLGDNFFAPTLATGLRSLLLTGVLFGLAEADARGDVHRPGHDGGGTTRMGDDDQSSIADTYLANLERKGRGEAEAWRQDFDALIHHLSRFITFRPGTRILEVGSGSGWFLILCRLRGWECRGIEINSRLIEYARESARRNGVELDIINGSIDTSDIGTDRYDVIVATSVFEHVEHWQAGVQAIADALAPGGVFYFYSTNRWYPRSGEHPLPFYSYCPRRVRYRLQQWRWGTAIMQYGIDFHHFTHGQLRRFFRQAGFSTVLDTYDLMDPDRLGMPTWWKKTLLRSIKGHAWLKEVALALHHGTMFVCIKDAGTER